jgi:hypothetical protein
MLESKNRLLKAALVVAVNLVVLVAILGAIELFFRLAYEPPRDPFAAKNGLWQAFRPYVMFTSAPGPYRLWHNDLTNEFINANVKTNSLGFNDPREFSLTEPYAKHPGERVVLFTGGSVAWGVGATATDKTVAGRVQFHLNRLQDDVQYTVVNLSMGSWIAIQQSIALQLWGRGFDPDWVVVMDGFNDAEVGCGFSQGVANPLYHATVKGYVDGYLFSKAKPVFFRGRLENELIRFSLAYRILSGKEYIEEPRLFDETSTEESYRRQITPTKVGESRAMLAFYLNTQKAMLNLFPRASYILSTQPTVNDFSGDFLQIYKSPSDSMEHRQAMVKREDELEQYLRVYENEACRDKTHQPSRTYIFVNGALRLERLADEEREAGRQVEYHNTGTLFPNDRADRVPYFIDPAHLSDKGADVLGQFYAERILAADAHPVAPAAARRPAPATPKAPAAVEPRLRPGVSIESATYGGNCGAKKGNATAAVQAVCDGRQSCEFVVDVKALGDPAPTCGKAFVVDYRCGPNKPPSRAEIRAEAGFGTRVPLCR